MADTNPQSDRPHAPATAVRWNVVLLLMAMAFMCHFNRISMPVAGTALVWAPAAIALYAQGRPGWALFLLLWGALLVGSVDNFLRPRLISGRAQISTLPVFFGVMGGLAAFGAIGMFVGPLIIALTLALVGFAEESREPGSSSAP